MWFTGPSVHHSVLERPVSEVKQSFYLSLQSESIAKGLKPA